MLASRPLTIRSIGLKGILAVGGLVLLGLVVNFNSAYRDRAVKPFANRYGHSIFGPKAEDDGGVYEAINNSTLGVIEFFSCVAGAGI